MTQQIFVTNVACGEGPLETPPMHFQRNASPPDRQRGWTRPDWWPEPTFPDAEGNQYDPEPEPEPGTDEEPLKMPDMFPEGGGE
jgi:hypothetical protein